MKCIASVLRDFRNLNRRFIESSRYQIIQPADGGRLRRIIRTDYRKTGVEEVRHGGTLPEELRIKANMEIAARSLVARALYRGNDDAFGCSRKDCTPEDDPMVRLLVF